MQKLSVYMDATIGWTVECCIIANRILPSEATGYCESKLVLKSRDVCDIVSGGIAFITWSAYSHHFTLHALDTVEYCRVKYLN